MHVFGSKDLPAYASRLALSLRDAVNRVSDIENTWRNKLSPVTATAPHNFQHPASICPPLPPASVCPKVNVHAAHGVSTYLHIVIKGVCEAVDIL
jgi:hypothetical protein